MIAELYRHRELVLFLTWREIAIRYKQAVLGIAWVILQPLTTTLVFSVVFGLLAKLPSEGTPYPVFTFAALLPWQLFSSAVDRGSKSLVSSAGLVTKIYFPRLAVPLSAVAAAAVDFVASFGVFLVLMVIYGIAPTGRLIAVPFLALLVVLMALGVSFIVSAANVLYRDVQYVVPFSLTLWMYISPVAYSSRLVPTGPLQLLYALNPLVGVIQGFRWALIGGPWPGWTLIVSCVLALAGLVGGLAYFRRVERIMADVV
ncbi:MAG: lipopolysaccharide transport system permease [Actinobacteria bacterium]|nr:MAG: lipopolysaccharide transport system permease [Actinomycetota bacterium]